MRLFQAALDTPLDSPFSTTLSVHGLHFTVCAPSITYPFHFVELDFLVGCNGGKLFYLQLELFYLQLSFFAYSPLRPLFEALSHCKQKSSNCK